ncbi:MAG: hypothetical protein J5950_03700 [Clostridia bacterium]|nr:hypothetical protein [Clostridia bacterium]
MNRYDIDKHFTVRASADTVTGRIRPLHGVNNAPYYFGGADNLRYLAEAHIPFSRLHDTCGPYGGSRYVDIANIFRDFDADENDPANYDFAATDDLLVNLCANGAEPFYRLGCTIENDPYGIGYRIFPPKDPAKWARICEHIIRHYNEGWANGHRLNIRYWEIWNEPDNEPDIDVNPMWRGTMLQFFELYRVTANHLKNCFPDLHIGGYGSCGFYSVVQLEASPNACVSERTAYFTEFFLKFLEFISDPATRAPLDFFSWHSYADEYSNVKFAEFARRTLDSFGFTKTESIFNEWNAGPSLRGTMCDASKIASMFITMHGSSADMMMYYDAQYIHSYSGMFSSDTHKPLKAYYSFKAYGELYADGEMILTEVSESCAKGGAKDNGQAADKKATGSGIGSIASRSHLLIVNRLDEPVYVSVETSGAEAGELYVLDETHDLARVNWDRSHIPLPPFGIALIKLEPV